MGYTTDFEGSFTCTPALNPDQVAYINMFSNTRRMARDAKKAEAFPDPLRLAVGLPIGVEGEYFVGSEANFGQDSDDSVTSYNSSAKTQPGLWCQWVSNEEGTEIEWNGAEKFYAYVEWLEYMNKHFFAKWGIVLNGEVEWNGESGDDFGKIIAKDGKIKTKTGKITYK